MNLSVALIWGKPGRRPRPRPPGQHTSIACRRNSPTYRPPFLCCAIKVCASIGPGDPAGFIYLIGEETIPFPRILVSASADEALPGKVLAPPQGKLKRRTLEGGCPFPDRSLRQIDAAHPGCHPVHVGKGQRFEMRPPPGDGLKNWIHYFCLRGVFCNCRRHLVV